MAHDVFISHAAADKISADMLCATLEQQGVRCWVAPRDVRPGSDWRSAILTAIRESRAMVLIFSDHANDSRHVNREVDCAIDAGIPVVPFRTQNVPARGSLEYSLHGLHWLDAVTPPIDNHMQRLAALLLAMIGGDAQATETLTVAPRAEPAVERTAVPSPPNTKRWLMIGLGVATVLLAIVATTFFYKPAPVAQPLPPDSVPAPIVPPANTSTAAPPGAEAPPPAEASADLPATAPVIPADATIFPTAQAQLLWEVDRSRASDFESAWKKLIEGLLRSNSADYQKAGRAMTIEKTASAEKNIYVVHVDPVVPGMNYQAGYLMANSGAFEPSETDALYRKMADGLGGLRAVALERIDLMPAEPAVVDRIPAMGMREAKDAFAFNTDQAQIVWVLKPGTRDAFEAAWRTIVAGLLRSPNERVRQAALGIAAFRTQIDTLVIFRIDKVTKGVSYDPGLLMYYAGTFARPTLDDLAGQVRAAIDAVTPWPLSRIR